MRAKLARDRSPLASRTLVRGQVAPRNAHPFHTKRQWAGGLWQPNEESLRLRAGRDRNPTRDRRHWSGDQYHPNKKSLGARTACGRSATRDRRHWSGDQENPGRDPMDCTTLTCARIVGIERGCFALSGQRLLYVRVWFPGRCPGLICCGPFGAGGGKCYRGTSATEKNDWSGKHWHTDEAHSKPHSRSKTLVRGPVPPKQKTRWGRGLVAVEACSQPSTLVGGAVAVGRRLLAIGDGAAVGVLLWRLR